MRLARSLLVFMIVLMSTLAYASGKGKSEVPDQIRRGIRRSEADLELERRLGILRRIVIETMPAEIRPSEEDLRNRIQSMNTLRSVFPVVLEERLRIDAPLRLAAIRQLLPQWTAEIPDLLALYMDFTSEDTPTERAYRFGRMGMLLLHMYEDNPINRNILLTYPVNNRMNEDRQRILAGLCFRESYRIILRHVASLIANDSFDDLPQAVQLDYRLSLAQLAGWTLYQFGLAGPLYLDGAYRGAISVLIQARHAERLMDGVQEGGILNLLADLRTRALVTISYVWAHAIAAVGVSTLQVITFIRLSFWLQQQKQGGSKG